MNQQNTIAKTPNFIVLDEYESILQGSHYQSEQDLENELIADLRNLGYEYVNDLNTPGELLVNARRQLQRLNDVEFSDAEWKRFCDEYLDKPSENLIEKTRKLQDDYRHDFTFDNGKLRNIQLADKKNIARNSVQVIHQFEQTGKHANRYDVTILVNGLPLVQIELKRRGVAIREAFNQIHRYSKESFNAENSLFKYLQIFVISNGTNTRYFANTTRRDKNSFDFTMNWARADNEPIRDLKDFAATFLQKNTLLSVLFHYSVFDVNDTLLIMRPYQIAAVERILWKIRSSQHANNWNSPDSGGYIWHTTGSGKTLTSFKAARLATALDGIEKVLFVVDRKDLDYQTMKEYQRFSPDSVNGSSNTTGLKRNLEKTDSRIVVTTIQKLNILMKSESDLPIYGKPVVFIFDEYHRSQFGEAQRNLRRRFKRFCQFGFTGTPIFDENALDAGTTASVFGSQLHHYVITHAIRDEKVLKFKVDYHNVLPRFRNEKTEKDEEKLSAAYTQQILLHPDRIKLIAQYVLDNFRRKTGRNAIGGNGFNAMFAVSSVEAAKYYYETFGKLQKGHIKPLRVATIFSFAPNEAQDAIGNIADENFEPTAMNTSAREFLAAAIDDYNAMFKTSYGVESSLFESYYKDLAQRVKKGEIDLLIVVGMFLTDFDTPKLNTLFVDKNLRYHGLIQAFSRINRIHDATKTFGNIVCFRDLEQNTIDAITLFGNSETQKILLERSYREYMEGYTDAVTGQARRSYCDVVEELQKRFPDPGKIETEKDKKAFAKLFGEYLRAENILKNYDEFAALQALQQLDENDADAVEQFKAAHQLTDEDLAAMRQISVPPQRLVQDYLSAYNDIRDWLRRQKEAEAADQNTTDWDDVVFEVDLLKSQEINLDYILELIFEHNRKIRNKAELVETIRRIIRATIDSRAKEGLIVDFINETDLDAIADKAGVIAAFFEYAQLVQKKEAEDLIAAESLNAEEARRYIAASLERGYASENGTGLNNILPKMSPLNPQYLTRKQAVFRRISAFVEKFKGVGGKI